MKLYPELLLTVPEDFEEKYEDYQKDGQLNREKIIDSYITKMSVLKGYKPVRQKEIERPIEQTVSQKDSNLGKREEREDCEIDQNVCELEERKKIFTEKAIQEETLSGVFFKEDMYDHICKCDSCVELYNQRDPFSGILTDKYYQDANYQDAVEETNALPEPVIEEPKENNDMEFLSYMENKFKERTGRNISPHEKLIMADHYGRLKQRLGDMILNSGKTEISEEDMRNFLQNLKKD